MDMKKCIAYGLYDWANSIWPTVVNAFVISAYFAKSVASTPEQGAILWGHMSAIVGLILAFFSPLMGAIIDQNHNEKKMVMVLTALCMAASLGLWWAYPEVQYTFLVLIVVGLGSVFSELAFVPYNSLLGRLFPRENWGKVSAWGFSLGYFGGIVALVLCLFGLVLNPEWLGLDSGSAEQIRVLGPIMAVWMGVFSIPLFLVKAPVTNHYPLVTCFRRGLIALKKTFAQVKQHRKIVSFLLAHMFYMDGLTTVFAFAGIYAANVFGMSLKEVMMFGIASQFFAGLGAWVFGWVDYYLGSDRSLMLALVLFIMMAIPVIVAEQVIYFYIFGLMCSMLIGPIQSSSRTLITQWVPKEQRTEMFGFFMLSGKVTSFLGPFLMALVISYFHSQRLGMLSSLILLMLGTGLYARVLYKYI